jgi:hypothetical protein
MQINSKLTKNVINKKSKLIHKLILKSCGYFNMLCICGFGQLSDLIINRLYSHERIYYKLYQKYKIINNNYPQRDAFITHIAHE